MRGKLITAIRDYLRTRITPAGAGKTSRCVCKSGRKRDHPRRCGENYLSARDYETAEGSPPQVRGKLVDSVNANHGDRITPAGAGKTGFPQCAWVSDSGSPPQVRGKQIYDRLITMEDRITPAGAGKTLGSTTQYVISWDHPRRCGENLFDSAFVFRLTGSPPQVRGKQAYCCLHSPPKRITPAGAGKTY